MAISLKVPHYSYKRLREAATEFLAKFHPTATIPVPIEEIAEFELGLNIIPIPSLQTILQVDGFISSDFRSISVDQFVMERREKRYRFTLAHEIAHLWLHHGIFSELKINSIDEWKKFQKEVNTEDYGWLEWQAYSLAGLILVPREALASHSSLCAQSAKEEGVVDPSSDAGQWYIIEMLSEAFNVSKGVIERRLAKDKEE